MWNALVVAGSEIAIRWHAKNAVGNGYHTYKQILGFWHSISTPAHFLQCTQLPSDWRGHRVWFLTKLMIKYIRLHLLLNSEEKWTSLSGWTGITRRHFPVHFTLNSSNLHGQKKCYKAFTPLPGSWYQLNVFHTYPTAD